ncbi:MAG: hypothetical protein KDC53_16220 [Saprospiraceae bacterium]|nr:hypothetical protein [Saprospiraceae bacterium]
MKNLGLIVILLFFTTAGARAQVDTTKSDDLLNELLSSQDAEPQLLPEKFLFTQKLLWGNKGLMRNFDRFKLSAEERANEMKIRRTMLTTHQILGFATLGGMVAQGIVGSKLYNGDSGIRDTHAAIGAAVNIGYFTTAGLSLFAPPKMVDERKGYSSIKLHRALAIVHLTSMITTNILAAQLESNSKLKPYHRAAAFTAFGSYAAAVIAIKF